MMDSLYVVARIAGERVAVPAREIESVIEIDEIVAVPLAPPHVAGLAALRSRVLTIVDARLALGLAAATGNDSRTALVCACEGHLYGMLVDAVEDVADLGDTPPAPLPAPLPGGWGRVATGLVTVAGDTILVVEASSLLRGPAPMLAA